MYLKRILVSSALALAETPIQVTDIPISMQRFGVHISQLVSVFTDYTCDFLWALSIASRFFFIQILHIEGHILEY